MGDHRSTVLFEALKSDTPVIVRRRKAVAQDAVQPLPGSQRLRTFERTDQHTGRIEDLAGGHVHTEFGGAEPEVAQRPRHHRLGDDASAAAGEFALDALVY